MIVSKVASVTPRVEATLLYFEVCFEVSSATTSRYAVFFRLPFLDHVFTRDILPTFFVQHMLYKSLFIADTVIRTYVVMPSEIFSVLELGLLGDHTCVSSVQTSPTLLQSGLSTAAAWCRVLDTASSQHRPCHRSLLFGCSGSLHVRRCHDQRKTVLKIGNPPGRRFLHLV